MDTNLVYLLQIETKQLIIGHSLTILPLVDSSNNYAMQQIYDLNATHGQAFLALEQTHGKGQRGKNWHTGIGENLALSIVIQPVALHLSQQFLLQMYVTSSIVAYLNTLQNGFKIKWPNDIYFNDRKAAGILIENSIKGNKWQYAVIGIGLNVNQENFNPQLINAISLKNITKTQYDLYFVASKICEYLQKNWGNFINNAVEFELNYNANLYKKGELVHLKQGNKTFKTKLQHVTQNGVLVCGTYCEYQFEHGTVEWVLQTK